MSSMGGVKKTFVYLTISRPLDFLACCGQESHERNQGKEAIRRCGFLYKPVADPLLGLEEAPCPSRFIIVA